MLHVYGGLTEEGWNGSFELASVVLVEALELSVLWRACQALKIVQVSYSLQTSGKLDGNRLFTPYPESRAL